MYGPVTYAVVCYKSFLSSVSRPGISLAIKFIQDYKFITMQVYRQCPRYTRVATCM